MKIIPILVAVVVIIPIISAAIIVVDSSSNEYDPNIVNVYLIAGQSNAQYYKTDVSVANSELKHIPDDLAYYYGTDAMPISPGVWSNMIYDSTFESYSIHPMVTDGDFTIGGIDAALASGFVTNTGQRCLIVNVGIGGASMSMYAPGGLAFDYAMAVFADAISKCPADWILKNCSVVWIQGESNTSTPVADYMQDFINMWDALQSSFDFNSILISKVRSINGVNSSFAQIRLAESLPDVHLATKVSDTFSIDNGLMTSDNLHYSQKGDNLIGVEVANYYLDHLYQKNDTSDYMPLLKMSLVLPLFAILVAVALFVVKFRHS